MGPAFCMTMDKVAFVSASPVLHGTRFGTELNVCKLPSKFAYAVSHTRPLRVHISSCMPSPSSDAVASNFSSTSKLSLATTFPPTIILCAILALVYPPSFLWFKTSFIIPFLSIIMLGMGLTTPPSSLLSLIRTPYPVLLGVASQYTLMPILATLLSRFLNLSPALAAGVILVGVCPGGVASNVVCLLGNADVSLSVALTLTSTLFAVGMIPLLMRVLAGALVPVNAVGLLLSTSQIVLFPLVSGFLLRALAPGLINAVSKFLPGISALAVTLICSGVVAHNAHSVKGIGITLVLCIALMHALGGLFGYLVGGAAGLAKPRRRTLAVEVMMQNSTLAVSLAIAHLADPITAVPGVISATMHAVMGSSIASWWRFRDGRRGGVENDGQA